ncbi:hypothetical protein AMATHDRAFT_111368, partial [Amanita thiersii Skay4041]
ERSLSRGREGYQSSGRGGLGNIRRASASRDARPETIPEDISVSRGREPRIEPTKIYSTGRGGAGNIRSPSRDMPNSPKSPKSPILVCPDEREREIIRTHMAHSAGRGGIGNITNAKPGSRSRSRDHSMTASQSRTSHQQQRSLGSPTPMVLSTGRGGAGNFVPKDAAIVAEVLEEVEAYAHAHGQEMKIGHSTGRGGLANLVSTTPGSPPVVEHRVRTVLHEYESTGRGGMGNI